MADKDMYQKYKHQSTLDQLRKEVQPMAHSLTHKKEEKKENEKTSWSTDALLIVYNQIWISCKILFRDISSIATHFLLALTDKSARNLAEPHSSSKTTFWWTEEPKQSQSKAKQRGEKRGNFSVTSDETLPAAAQPQLFHVGEKWKYPVKSYSSAGERFNNERWI